MTVLNALSESPAALILACTHLDTPNTNSICRRRPQTQEKTSDDGTSPALLTTRALGAKSEDSSVLHEEQELDLTRRDMHNTKSSALGARPFLFAIFLGKSGKDLHGMIAP